MENSIGKVPIHLKMTLTAKEAAEYSNIGINKIDGKLRSPNCPFVLFVGRTFCGQQEIGEAQRV